MIGTSTQEGAWRPETAPRNQSNPGKEIGGPHSSVDQQLSQSSFGIARTRVQALIELLHDPSLSPGAHLTCAQALSEAKVSRSHARPLRLLLLAEGNLDAFMSIARAVHRSQSHHVESLTPLFARVLGNDKRGAIYPSIMRVVADKHYAPHLRDLAPVIYAVADRTASPSFRDDARRVVEMLRPGGWSNYESLHQAMIRRDGNLKTSFLAFRLAADSTDEPIELVRELSHAIEAGNDWHSQRTERYAAAIAFEGREFCYLKRETQQILASAFALLSFRTSGMREVLMDLRDETDARSAAVIDTLRTWRDASSGKPDYSALTSRLSDPDPAIREIGASSIEWLTSGFGPIRRNAGVVDALLPLAINCAEQTETRLTVLRALCYFELTSFNHLRPIIAVAMNSENPTAVRGEALKLLKARLDDRSEARIAPAERTVVVNACSYLSEDLEAPAGLRRLQRENRR